MSTAATSVMSSAAATSQMYEALENLLRVQLEDHRKLLSLIDRKGQALRRAQIDEVNDLCHEEQSIVQRLAEMERHRMELIRRIGKPGGRPKPAEARKPPTISELAEHAPDQAAGVRLRSLGQQLRAAVQDVRQRSSVVRAAAEGLARHVSGVMQGARAALSRAGVYGRSGHLAAGAQISYSVDLKS